MKNLVRLFCLFHSICTFGQIDTIYLTSEYGFTNKLNEAAYLRIIEDINADKTTKVTDLLKTGEKYFNGSVVYLNSDLPVNDYTFYYKNGKIKCEGKMDNITEKGFKGFTERTYYTNGQLRSEQTIVNGEEKFLKAFDSLGSPTIIDGHGLASLEIFYYNLLWTGKVKNYKRDSTWIGVDTRTGKVLHSEEFKQGKFIRGKTWAKEGVITYNRVSSSIPSKLISKIKKEVKKEIIVKVGKVKTKYKIGLLFRDGQIIEVRHLIRDINEEQINLTGVIIPTGFIFLERGLPIEWMTLGVKL